MSEAEGRWKKKLELRKRNSDKNEGAEPRDEITPSSRYRGRSGQKCHLCTSIVGKKAVSIG